MNRKKHAAKDEVMSQEAGARAVVRVLSLHLVGFTSVCEVSCVHQHIAIGYKSVQFTVLSMSYPPSQIKGTALSRHKREGGRTVRNADEA